jgi:Xaa-Pro aminopeptidase
MPARDPSPLVNLPRLERLMDEAKLDALVLRSGHNFTYLSGVVYPGTLARHQDFADSPRAVLLVWPRHGKPIIISNSTAAGLAQRDSWVEAIEIYEGYVEPPYALLARVLAREGLGKARVGFEKNVVSAADWELVATALPELQMVDCVALMDRVRWVKTPAEIAKLKVGADLLDDAYREVFETIRDGDTERSVHTKLVERCLAKGCGWVHGILNSSTNTISYAGEGDTRFRRGDVVRTDYVAYLDGYPGHQSRNAILGPATAQQLSEYHTTLDIYRRTIDRCRAGTTAGEVYDFVVRGFAQAGWEYTNILIGHGVGSWWHQQAPILSRGNDIVLEDGMVLALEPAKGYWHIQDMIVVRDGAPELISDKFPTDDPFIVPI